MNTSSRCWRALIGEEMKKQKETWGDVVDSTLSAANLARQWPSPDGSSGAPFTLWTKTRVYFPAVYDGAEWVSSVPRNPNGEKSNHVGGE